MGLPIVASLQLPKWMPDAVNWPRCWLITPRWSYFRAPDWKGQYLAQLERFGVQRIARELETIARDNKVGQLVICCFELTGSCHRHAWADWWLSVTGEAVEEVAIEQLTLPVEGL